MIRLLKIELRKISTYKAFWLITGLYAFLLAFLIFGIPGLIDYIAEKTPNNTQIRIFKAIVFNFPDIWQNITFVASLRYFIKIIIGIIVIITITNEFTFQTIRLNIVNGMSRSDFILSKLQFIILLSLASTLIIFLSGLYLGLMYSSAKEFSLIFSKSIFLLAYFIEISTYLIFALFIGILIKKTGFSIIVFMLYLLIEPIIDYKIPDKYCPYLPLNAMNSLIRTPNTSLIKIKSPGFNYDFQEFLAISDVAICLGYAALFIGLIYLILKKRNL